MVSHRKNPARIKTVNTRSPFPTTFARATNCRSGLKLIACVNTSGGQPSACRQGPMTGWPSIALRSVTNLREREFNFLAPSLALISDVPRSSFPGLGRFGAAADL